MAEPVTDRAPATPAARWTDYEVSYTLGGAWTSVEWFRIVDGPLVLAELPALIASRHRYRPVSADEVAVLRIEVVADDSTGTVLHRWLREIDQAQNQVQLRMITARAEDEHMCGPDAASRAQAEVFTRRVRDRELALADLAPYAHCHSTGLHLQPLPDCLAATPADRDAQPLLHMPHPGEPVVLYAGEVLWLERCAPNGPLSRDNTVLLHAPMRDELACQGARWDGEHLAPFDEDELGLDAGENQAIAIAWDLLIQDANHADLQQRQFADHPGLYDHEPPVGQVVPRPSPPASGIQPA